MLKEGFHFDDFTYDSTGDYTWDFAGDPTYAWNSLDQEIDITLTGDGQAPAQFYDDNNLPHSGYLRIVCHSSYIWSDDFGLFVYIVDDKTLVTGGSGYSFIVTGDGSSSYEGISKMTDWVDDDKAGPYTGTLVTPDPSASCNIDIKIECWWSPAYCRMLINDSIERTLTPSVNTSEVDIKNISIYYFDGNFSLREMELRAWSGKIGRNRNIYHYNFSEVGPMENLRGYWPLNGDTIDYSGYFNDGEVTGSTLDYTAPRDRACYNFNDLTERIDLSSLPYITLASASDWSISFWGYKTSYGSRDGICSSTGLTDGNIYFTAADGLVIAVSVTSATFASFTPIFPTNAWFNCIITNNNGVTNIYNDGDPISVIDQPLSGDISLRRIGNNYSLALDYDFNGLMFDFRVYNKILTLEEINILATMYNTVSPVTESMLGRYAWYTFGEFKEN